MPPVAHNAPCPQARQQEGEERAQCKLIMGINGAMGSPQQKPMSQDHFTDASQTSPTLPRMLGNWQEPAVQSPPEHSQKVDTPFSGRWKQRLLDKMDANARIVLRWSKTKTKRNPRGQHWRLKGPFGFGSHWLSSGFPEQEHGSGLSSVAAWTAVALPASTRQPRARCSLPGCHPTLRPSRLWGPFLGRSKKTSPAFWLPPTAKFLPAVTSSSYSRADRKAPGAAAWCVLHCRAL